MVQVEHMHADGGVLHHKVTRQHAQIGVLLDLIPPKADHQIAHKMVRLVGVQSKGGGSKEGDVERE